MLVTGDEFIKKKKKKTKEWRKIINANVFLCCTSIIEWFEVAVSSIFIWVSFNSVWQSIGYWQDVQNMALWPLGILDNILSGSQPQGKDALLKNLIHPIFTL